MTNTQQALTREQIIGHPNPTAAVTVEATRVKRYPVVAHPGPQWVWLYQYRADGGPRRTWGTGVADFRRWLRRTFPNAAIVETWKSPHA